MNDPLADLLDEIEGDYRTEAEFFAAQAEWLRANRDRVIHLLYPDAYFPSAGPGDPKDCPGQHGSACCGWPEICRETLKAGEDQ